MSKFTSATAAMPGDATGTIFVKALLGDDESRLLSTDVLAGDIVGDLGGIASGGATFLLGVAGSAASTTASVETIVEVCAAVEGMLTSLTGAFTIESASRALGAVEDDVEDTADEDTD